MAATALNTAVNFLHHIASDCMILLVILSMANLCVCIAGLAFACYYNYGYVQYQDSR